MQERACCTGEQRKQECRSQIQRWKQSSCNDLKRQLTEVDAACLALPGLPSARQISEGSCPPSEVQNYLLSMQGVNCRQSGPEEMCAFEKMRKGGRRNMRRKEGGSLFSDECNIKETRWKSLRGQVPDSMEMGWGSFLFKSRTMKTEEEGPTSFPSRWMALFLSSFNILSSEPLDQPPNSSPELNLSLPEPCRK